MRCHRTIDFRAPVSRSFEPKALGAVFAGVVLSLLACGSSEQSVGDATLTDHGWNAYEPRYEIVFEPVHLETAARKRFHVTRVPRAPYALELRIASDQRERIPLGEYMDLIADLEEDRVRLAVTLTADRDVIAAFEGLATGDWGRGGTGTVQRFQSLELSNLPLGKYPSFELEIRIKRRGAVDLSHISLHPRLVGGGRDAM